MVHQFKSADERRKECIERYSEVGTERRNSKKTNVQDRAIAYLTFCLIMFFAVSFIVHSFHWMNEEGYLFVFARIGYVFLIFVGLSGVTKFRKS